MLALILAADQPDEMAYVWASYVVAVVVLAAFAVATIVRGRRVGRQLPPEDRRWM
ncbi:MAG: heme exporter protein CcmD [Acidimicrobiales bacterium]|nr:heme exporter protein CcmD [Actinomycetota bacterium]